MVVPSLPQLGMRMAELAHGTPPEFWRPPSPMVEEVTVQEPTPGLMEACPKCGTEFLLGSRFCHTCGGKRPLVMSAAEQADAAAIARLWQQVVHHLGEAFRSIPWRRVKFPTWLNRLHFHAIKSCLGLSTASLIAFVMGLGCVGGALLVGLFTVRSFVDWQAIQYYRAEWLLAATAAFVAGILLKKQNPSD
jgi:hypothetical protein